MSAEHSTEATATTPVAMDDRRQLRVAIGCMAMGMPLPHNVWPSWIRSVLMEKFLRLGFANSHWLTFNGHAIVSPTRGVYVLGAVGSRAVKVGWSENIERRIINIGQVLPCKSVLVATKHAESYRDEARLHRAMKPWHRRNEWFHFTPESRAFIEREFRLSISDSVARLIGISASEESAYE